MFRRNPHTRRRAAALILVLIALPVILGMAALTVDVGAMFNTRIDLQNAADAAALAGVSAYVTDPMMMLRLGSDSSSLVAQVQALVNERAPVLSMLNPLFGAEATALEVNDIQVGWIDLDSATSPLQTGVPGSSYNAVQVTVRRSDKGGNGPLRLFFASIFGVEETNITASAVAAFDDRVRGIDVGDSGGALLPFTVHEDVYEQDLVSGDDLFGYDDGWREVTSGADGVREINLYPHDVGPGNDGILNLPSSSSNGTPEIREQIENGVQPEDIELDIGGSEITFVDESGDPTTYTLDGNPGFIATLESSIETRIGDVIAFLLYDQTNGAGGNNLTYRITDIRFGRVLGVSLKQKPRGIWIQPTIYSGGGVRLSTGAASSGGMTGRIVLAR